MKQIWHDNSTHLGFRITYDPNRFLALNKYWLSSQRKNKV
jgi:hypothetical protein